MISTARGGKEVMDATKKDHYTQVVLPPATKVWNERARPGYVYKIAGEFFFFDLESGYVYPIMYKRWYPTREEAVKEHNSFHEHMAHCAEDRIKADKRVAAEHRAMKIVLKGKKGRA